MDRIQSVMPASRKTPVKRKRKAPEFAFQKEIIKLAQRHGWMYFYNLKPQYQRGKGFPDLVLIRPRRLIFAEVKARRGQLSPHQRTWITWLKMLPCVEVYTWKPRDWATIERTLKRYPPK